MPLLLKGATMMNKRSISAVMIAVTATIISLLHLLQYKKICESIP
jgi:hypothetical protein